jgi:hypothetical protein
MLFREVTNTEMVMIIMDDDDDDINIGDFDGSARFQEPPSRIFYRHLLYLQLDIKKSRGTRLSTFGLMRTLTMLTRG